MEYKTLGEQLREDEGVARVMRDRRGSATITLKGLMDMEEKTTLTSTAVGREATGVLQVDRRSGIRTPARRRLFMRDLLTAVPTSMQVVDYVKVTTSAVIVTSPQTETSAKQENAMAFSTASANVKTLATWLPATRQVLDDYTELEGFIGSALKYAVRKKEDEQILAGDNTGQNLNGLTTQATAFDTALLVAADGWEYADMLARAKQQLEVADELESGFVALAPSVYWSIRLTKDSNGRFIYGDPSTPERNFTIFGLTPIRTNAINATKFLVGSTAPDAAVIRDRQEITVTISTSHDDYFTRNQVAILAEERVALQVFRPASFILGTFSQSPA